MPDSPKSVGRTWHSTLLLAVLVVAGGACAGVRLTGDQSLPAADTSPFLVRTFELRNQDSNAPAARAFAMDPEWTRLALPASDGTVQIFNVASGESDGPPLDGGIRTGFTTFDYEPFTFTFTSNGTLLVWSFGKKVVVWQVDSREILLKQEVDEVWDLEAVPPTHRVLSEPEREQPWTRGRCLPSPLTSLLLSHDGGLLSDACMVTDLWDLSRPTSRRMLRTGYLPASLTQEPSVLSRDGRTLAYTWGSGRHLLGGGGFGLWDVASGRAVGPRIKVRDFARLQISPDGRLLATSGRGRGADGKSSFAVQLWSVDALRAGGEGEMPDPAPAGTVTDGVN